jgi:hypothetical protein
MPVKSDKVECVCPTAGSVYCPLMQMADVLMSWTCTTSPKQHKLVTVWEFSLLGPQGRTCILPSFIIPDFSMLSSAVNCFVSYVVHYTLHERKNTDWECLETKRRYKKRTKGRRRKLHNDKLRNLMSSPVLIQYKTLILRFVRNAGSRKH